MGKTWTQFVDRGELADYILFRLWMKDVKKHSCECQRSYTRNNMRFEMTEILNQEEPVDPEKGEEENGEEENGEESSQEEESSL